MSERKNSKRNHNGIVSSYNDNRFLSLFAINNVKSTHKVRDSKQSLINFFTSENFLSKKSPKKVDNKSNNISKENIYEFTSTHHKQRKRNLLQARIIEFNTNSDIKKNKERNERRKKFTTKRFHKSSGTPLKSFQSIFEGNLVILKLKPKMILSNNARLSNNTNKRLRTSKETKELYKKLSISSYRRNVEYNSMTIIRRQDKIKRNIQLNSYF